MARIKSITVKELAVQAQLDIDETIIELWQAGIEYVDQPSSIVKARDTQIALKSLNIQNTNYRKIQHWENILKMSNVDVRKFLFEANVLISPQAKTLPKAGIKELRKLYKQKYGTSLSFSATKDNQQLLDAPPFIWESSQDNKHLVFLTEDEVMAIHFKIAEDAADSGDPVFPVGVKSRDLLESAVNRPKTSLGTSYKYCNVEDSAAALLHALVHNHPFHNGNKRTALVSMLVFLDKQGYILDTTSEDLFEKMVKLAAHRILPSNFRYDSDITDREVKNISEWLSTTTRKRQLTERVINWRQLQRILRNFDCEITSSGSENLIIRKITTKRRLLADKTEILTAKYKTLRPNEQVAKHKIRDIRSRLRLDDKNGVDSLTFYENGHPIDDFIVEYSKVLSRLSKI